MLPRRAIYRLDAQTQLASTAVAAEPRQRVKRNDRPRHDGEEHRAAERPGQVIAPGSNRQHESRDDHDDVRREKCREREAAVVSIRPREEGQRQGADEHQPRPDSRDREPFLNAFLCRDFPDLLQAELGSRAFRWKPVVLALDLAELDRPVDFAHVTFLTEEG